MKKRLIVAVLLVGASLAGASVAQSSARMVDPAGPPSSPGHPAYGTFGFDLSGMDRSVKPGDNFYQFASGNWDKTHPIPSDKAGYTIFNQLADLSDARTRLILDQQAKTPGSKIGAAYTTYLNTAAIDAKGLAPIRPWLDHIEALTSKAGYPALAAEAARNGVGGPFGSGVGQDEKDPNVYVVSLRQGGLGLPDPAYYTDPSPKFAEARTNYQAHIARMFTLAGLPDAEARAKAILDYETAIAKVHWDRAKTRDADLNYNKTAMADLAKEAPGFDFAAYFRAAGTLQPTVIVGQPPVITAQAALIASTPLQVLKDQLILRSLDGYADVLPHDFDAEHFDFFSHKLQDVPEQQARWKRAVAFTNDALADDVARIYVARYFPPATKAAADQLVRNIIAAMNARIDKLNWMAPATKAEAHAKLAAFTPKIGYPSRWHDYSALRIVPGDAFGNKLRAANWDHDWNRGKLGKPIMRWEWGMTPMTVNAYANPPMVEIVFPAAILQPPYFDPNADPAVNYGGIGAVIGHEMSHHFDDQGAKYDPHGRLTQWWTQADIDAFKQRSDNLVAQYDAYEPLPGMHIKGRQTLGENSADLAGLNAAYDAYHNTLGGRPAPVIDGFTGDQRFYLGFAQVWRGHFREGATRQRLLVDVHSPGDWRTWEVRNLDPWYAAFKVQPGDKMYLPPDQRVRIW